MRLCINPNCQSKDGQNQDIDHLCENCKCELLIDNAYSVKRLLSNNSGFGIVYEVEDAEQHPKILKILRPEFNVDPKTISLFEQEAFILGRISHSGLPKIDAYIHHYLPDKSILYGIVMEKIEGVNLNEWRANHKLLSEKMAIGWMRQIVKVLQIVHQNGYFHRDIKPANIMLRPSGKLALIDFGTAREATYTYLAKIGSVGGITKISSAGYTSPEQERGFAIPQSDFYSLGMTFLYLVTGRHPLDLHDSYTDVYHWRELAPQISDGFAKLLERLISNRPVDRPNDCDAFLHSLDELDRLAKEHQTEHQTQIKQKQKQQEQKQVRTKIWIGLAIALVGVAGYAIGVYNKILPSPLPSTKPLIQSK